MPSMNSMAQEVPAQTPAKSKKDHWMVEIAGGVTLAATIVSGVSLWYVMLIMRVFNFS